MSDRLEPSFARTWQLLAVAKLRARASVILALVLLFSGWVLWLFFGKVPIYATSRQARFESTRSPLPVQAPTQGVVARCNLALGQRVREGEELIGLDARILENQKAQAEAELKADLSDVDSLNAEIEAQTLARQAIASLVGNSARAGRARVQVSRTTAHFRDEEGAVVSKLSEQDLVSKLDQLRAQEDTATNHAQVAATAAMAAQETSSHNATLIDRDAQIAELRKQVVDAEGKVDVLRATVEGLQYQIELRSVRAMSSGTLIDIIPCAVGMTVTTEQSLATLLPDAEIHVVSFFDPKESIGRIAPGQLAILRIDNYPWTQYGTVGATVEHVGSEPRDGFVRVELKVSHPNPAIPVVHGLTGLAEIEVERITPMQLVLRTVGKKTDVPSNDQRAKGGPRS